MAEGYTPTKPKRTLRCTLCRRILTDCNAEPCPGKADKKSRSRGLASSLGGSAELPNGSQEDVELRSSTERVRSKEDEAISQMLAKMIYNDQTGEPQAYIIGQLEAYVGLRGNSHWCCVRGYDEFGLCVDVLVEAATERWILNEIHFLWKELPFVIQQMPLEERKEFCRSRMPVGSEFRGVITKLCGNSVWLTMSKNANPKLRLDRSLIEPPFASESSSTFKCPYRYLIMLDLEATCDYAPNPIVDVSTAEVTEFPWVVLDTQTGSIVYERQMFVRPDNLEAVTYYCTKLTGISQEMVRDGVKLQTAMQLLDEYISSTFGAEDRGSFRIVTDGIWDLSIQLYTECKRKGIERPWYFSEYFDLKDCFCRAFPFFPPSFKPSLITLLNAVGLQVVGQHHRGLDDCKTIAQIVQLLLKLGFPFDNLKTVPNTPDYNPWQHPDFVDFGSRCEPDSWKCTTPDCGIWNRPWMYYCRFCDCRQTDQTLQKHLDASAQRPS